MSFLIILNQLGAQRMAKNRQNGLIKKYFWPIGGTRFKFRWSEVLSWVKFSGKHKVLYIKKRFFWALPSAWLSLAILLTRFGTELPEMLDMPKLRPSMIRPARIKRDNFIFGILVLSREFSFVEKRWSGVLGSRIGWTRKTFVTTLHCFVRCLKHF